MPTPRPNGHYEVRQHATVKGLLSIVWIEPGQAPGSVLNLAPERLPLVAKGLNDYLTRNPQPAEGEAS